MTTKTTKYALADVARFNANVAAIQALRALERERRTATEAERQVLTGYASWGNKGVLDQLLARRDGASPDPAVANAEPLLDERSLRYASTEGALTGFYTPEALARAIWSGLKAALVPADAPTTQGTSARGALRVLEPAAGTGVFLRTMPDAISAGAVSVAVEIDPVAAGILKQVVPAANVLACPFEKAPLSPDSFDLVIGNVPFANVPVADVTAPKPLRRCLHDYFFYKALTLLAPGGVMALITSRFTLDKKDDALRRFLARHADLVCALRLPENAFAEAGTEVVTDLVVLQMRRARADGKPCVPAEHWVQTVLHNGTQRIQDYQAGLYKDAYSLSALFEQRKPKWVLGAAVHNTKATHHADRYTVKALAGAGPLERIVAHVLTDVIKDTVVTLDTQAAVAASHSGPATEPDTTAQCADGKGDRHDDWFSGQFDLAASTEAGSTKPLARAKRMSGEDDARRDAIGQVYASAQTLLELEAAGRDEAEVGQARRALNQAYDAMLWRFGAISSRANAKLLRDHPAWPFLRALEVVDPASGVAAKADIFRTRRVRAQSAVTHVDDPVDALSVCLDVMGKVDVDFIAKLTRRSADDVTQALAGHIFAAPEVRHESCRAGDDQPQRGFITNDEYLSGDVKAKIAEARAAAVFDKRFEANVEALERVQPEDIPVGEITARLGANWIEPELIDQFAGKLFGFPVGVRYAGVVATYLFAEPHAARASVAARTTWGTSRVNGVDLMLDALNGRLPTVRDEVTRDGNTVMEVNQIETVAAQAKLAEIKARFEAWAWEDPERAAELAETYNEKRNRWRARSYDGSHLTLPGLSVNFNPYPSQKNAIWRLMQNRSCLIGHPVGRGKTAIMVIAAHELKRLGLVHKPMITCLNGQSQQMLAMALELYPNLRVLCASERDFSKAKRGEFLSRVATGNWDLVIVEHSQFKLLPVSTEREERYFEDQRDALDEYLTDCEDRATQKEVARAIKRLEVRLEELKAMKRDSAITMTFERLGIDLLYVDEMHCFKNLFVPTKMTRVSGMPSAMSQRAFDMYLKLSYMLEYGRVAGATADFVANSMAEAYVMQLFFSRELLQGRGLAHFDAWALEYGDVISAVELSPDGSKLRVVSAFARFVNVPELMDLWLQTLDLTSEDPPGTKIPKMITGGPITVELPAQAGLKRYFREVLNARAEKVRSGRVDPSIDNLLKISDDARKASLDLRLRVPGAIENPLCKVNVVAMNVFQVWRASAPNKGAQLVFCDMGVPKGRPDRERDDDEENEETAAEQVQACRIYDAIRTQLLKLGVPECEIAYVQDVKNSAARLALQGRVNAGEVRVLMGSREKMGAGMNAQRRLVASHHVTLPYRPVDLNQSDGRILRPGNGYDAVAIFHYVVVGSFDAFMLGKLERKARFISQVKRGQVSARQIEDVSADVLTYAQIKALATGNPKMVRRVAVENELTRLEHVRVAWRNTNWRNQCELRVVEDANRDRELHLAALREALACQPPDDAFEMSLVASLGDPDGPRTTFREKAAAGQHLQQLCMRVMARNAGKQRIGETRSFKLFARPYVEMDGRKSCTLSAVFKRVRVLSDVQSAGEFTLRSLNYQLNRLDELLARNEREHAAGLVRARELAQASGATWLDADKYEALKTELTQLDAELGISGARAPGETQSTVVAPVEQGGADDTLGFDVSIESARVREGLRPVYAELYGVHGGSEDAFDAWLAGDAELSPQVVTASQVNEPAQLPAALVETDAEFGVDEAELKALFAGAVETTTVATMSTTLLDEGWGGDTDESTATTPLPATCVDEPAATLLLTTLSPAVAMRRGKRKSAANADPDQMVLVFA